MASHDPERTAALVATLAGGSIWQPPALLVLYLGGLDVPLGGIVMTRLVDGAPGLRTALRIVDPRRIAGRWWAIILLFFPVLTLLAAGIA